MRTDGVEADDDASIMSLRDTVKEIVLGGVSAPSRGLLLAFAFLNCQILVCGNGVGGTRMDWRTCQNFLNHGFKVIEYPADLAKVRLQAQLLTPPTDERQRFKGPVDCLTKTWKNEGLRGLYRVRSPSVLVFPFINGDAGSSCSRFGLDGGDWGSIPCLWIFSEPNSHISFLRRHPSITTHNTSAGPRCRWRGLRYQLYTVRTLLLLHTRTN